MKKKLKKLQNIFISLLYIFSLLIMIFTIVSVTTFNRNDRSILGYRFYIVNSDSMSATDFDAGDLIITKEVDPQTLQEGDIISFISQDSSSFGETVTHKIRSLTVDEYGNNGFVTYGTTTNNDDSTIVTYPYILGKYSFSIPNLGSFFNFLKTPQGYFICIFIPFMILIISQGYNTIALFRKYKKEQMIEMEKEREKIKTEKEENAKMLEELRALKAQLEGKKSSSNNLVSGTVFEDKID